jgi:hypothetical protein
MMVDVIHVVDSLSKCERRILIGNAELGFERAPQRDQNVLARAVVDERVALAC